MDNLWIIYESSWWLNKPSEKYEFVNWDDELPNIWKNKIHVPVTTNQVKMDAWKSSNSVPSLTWFDVFLSMIVATTNRHHNTSNHHHKWPTDLLDGSL